MGGGVSPTFSHKRLGGMLIFSRACLSELARQAKKSTQGPISLMTPRQTDLKRGVALVCQNDGCSRVCFGRFFRASSPGLIPGPGPPPPSGKQQVWTLLGLSTQEVLGRFQKGGFGSCPYFLAGFLGVGGQSKACNIYIYSSCLGVDFDRSF